MKRNCLRPWTCKFCTVCDCMFTVSNDLLFYFVIFYLTLEYSRHLQFDVLRDLANAHKVNVL